MDLNSSRLDLFYWLLTCIGIANLVFYVVVATRYSYKTVMAGGKVVDDKASTSSAPPPQLLPTDQSSS
uniref:Uncharacterized protein n=1 Tax=Oryza barthii TaxID=65489 RepID=A0A0D3EP32_9ORYZ